MERKCFDIRDMSWMELKGSGNAVKGRLKQWLGRWLSDEVVYEEGVGDEWLGRMQKRLSRCRARRLRMK